MTCACANELDRFHLFSDVVDRSPQLQSRAAYVHQFVREELVDNREFIEVNADDPSEIRDWTWSY